MQPTADTAATIDEPGIYHGGFWLAYTANVLLVCANSLTFRFAEFVAFLAGNQRVAGGTEQLSGLIVSAGLIAAVLARFWLGQAIDRYGPRKVWLTSSLAFIAGGVGFLVLSGLSPTIWIARIAYSVGLAGMFSCSMVHIQNQVPPHRRTEVIGVLGTSGFVGTIIGTQFGDLVFTLIPPGYVQFLAMFGGAVLLGVIHVVVVFVLTRNDVHRAPDETPASHLLLIRYWPGAILLVAMAMGTSLTVTTVFLTRYATSLHLRGIGTFFFVYSLTAFSCRWLTRSWGGASGGRHQMVLWGLAGLTAGQLMFLTVTTEWLFLPPALLCGFGHALLFPAVVSLGAGCFPVHYRGSGTTLVLGFTELGTIVAGPVLGAIIDHWNRSLTGAESGLGFAYMFLTAGAFALVVNVSYALTAARRPERDVMTDSDTEQESSSEPAATPVAESSPEAGIF